ncbi:MAG: SIR2 family NAD-dependent protein deacylase [Anaerolineales bacterium]
MEWDEGGIHQGLIAKLRNSNHITVLTGAGISAESGVPTFRQAQSGLWAQYDPQQLATPQAFRRNPRLVWEWYSWRRELVNKAKPNPGHIALATMEQQVSRFTLITQNVDDLHRRAGSQNIIALHGDILKTRCIDCHTYTEDALQNENIPPRCFHCGGLLRPDVVWFGESLPTEALEAAFTAARECDLFLSIGTSTLVEPSASLPFIALQNDIPVVEINPEETPLSRSATYQLKGAAGKVLPELVRSVWQV